MLKKAAELGGLPSPFIISTVNLILCSYPNSVCNECSLGLIALRNSSKNGFLKTLIDLINQPGSLFRTVVIQQENGTDRPIAVELNVIIGSNRIFNNDVSGAFLKHNPGAKLDFQGLATSFQQ